MAIILFDNTLRKQLYPITNTCAVADIRAGIFSSIERWHTATPDVFISTEPYLQSLYGDTPGGVHIWIDAAVLPGKALMEQLLQLQPGNAVAHENKIVACCGDIKNFRGDITELPAGTAITIMEVKKLQYAWDIFYQNTSMLISDFEILKTSTSGQELPGGVIHHGEYPMYISEGANIEYCTINTKDGPVFIGKNVTIMDGAFLRGPLAIGEGTTVKMGAKIYGGTTIGPYCVAGGEIKGAVMQSYSNKAHDGYLGDAVIGSWCNMGAGTSNSNVKNTAGPVKIWDAHSQSYIETQVKCGVVMGSYTRTAINTSINTGTVIGTCCNIFNDGLLPKYIPDFQWGGKGITRYELDKSLRDIDNWKKMKGEHLSDAEKQVLKYIFEAT